MSAGKLTVRTVQKLKGSGFWLSTTESELVMIVGMLMMSGSTEEAACNAIERMWRIVSSEYGE